MTEPSSVLITGTTSGLGRALLEYCVLRGIRTIAVNRRSVPDLEALYPHVVFERVDVRDADAVEKLVRRLIASEALPDTFFLNAGINEVDNDASFGLKEYKSVIETNLFGVLHFVAPLTKIAPASTRRHIVAISSMASYVGNPYGLGYFTSKRSLSACFDVWSKMYAGTDLVFQQVMLGPVPTKIKTMERDFPSWMVRARDMFSGDLNGCVEKIAWFAQTEKKKLITPRRAVPLYLGMKLGSALIPGFLQGRTTLGGEARRKHHPPFSGHSR